MQGNVRVYKKVLTWCASPCSSNGCVPIILLIVCTVNVLALQVASEDTVLYTAERYVASQETHPLQHTAARQQLARVVRCPHLSDFWLMASVLSGDKRRLLRPVRQQLKQLRLAWAADPSQRVTGDKLLQLLPEAPHSWALGPRISRAVGPVQVVWKLDVSKLKEAAMRCVAQRSVVRLAQHPQCSPPLGGIAFTMQILCNWLPEGAGGCRCGVFVGPTDIIPQDIFCSFHYRLEAHTAKGEHGICRHRWCLARSICRHRWCLARNEHC